MSPSPYLLLWQRPRLVAWMIAVAVLHVGIRAIFHGIEPIPGLVELQVGFVVVLMAGVYCGPAGVAGVVAGAAIGDALFGWFGIGTLFRALGAGTSAAWAARLWASIDEPWTDPRAGWRFCRLGIPCAFGFAAWTALGSYRTGLYPFGYLFGITLAAVLWFFLPLAPGVFSAVRRNWLPVFGCWYTELAVRPPPDPLSIRLFFAGSVVAGPLGGAVGHWLYGTSPWATASPGAGEGPMVWLAVLGCLLAANAGLVRRPRAPESPGRTSVDRNRSRMPSPIKRV